MANHFEPLPLDYRKRYQGCVLLETHALAGNWDEFLAMLRQDTRYAPVVLNWFCAEDQVDYHIYEHAKVLARAMLDGKAIGDCDALAVGLWPSGAAQ